MKEFLKVDTIRDHAIRLADTIYHDGYIPTVIIVSLRGGSTFGNVISEYFKLILPIENPPLYAAVVAHSYIESVSAQRVSIDGWTLSPKHLRKSDRVLLVDDIFDSGFTVNFLAETLIRYITPNQLRIAVHDYKIRLYQEHNHKYLPDYYSRKLVIEKPEDDNWIHYTSHELDGLTEEEIQTHYKPEICPYISRLLEVRKRNLKSYKNQ